jgi:hypothetical protein
VLLSLVFFFADISRASALVLAREQINITLNWVRKLQERVPVK